MVGFFACFLAGLSLLRILQTFSCRVEAFIVFGQQMFIWQLSLVALERQSEIEFNRTECAEADSQGSISAEIYCLSVESGRG